MRLQLGEDGLVAHRDLKSTTAGLPLVADDLGAFDGSLNSTLHRIKAAVVPSGGTVLDVDLDHGVCFPFAETLLDSFFFLSLQLM